MKPRAWWLGAALVALSTGLTSQESPEVPQGSSTQVTASYALTAQAPEEGPWTTHQTLVAALAGRWGSTLLASGQISSNLDGASLSADDLLDQLSLTWNLDTWGNVTVGKQRLKWGTAQVLSAIEGLEPRYDALDPTAVLAGVTGARVDVLPTDWLSLEAVFLPTAVLDEARWALRCDAVLGETDLAVGLVRRVASGVQELALTGESAQEWGGLGLYGEGQWRVTGGGSGTLPLRATLGGSLQVPTWLPRSLVVLGEYHFNGEDARVGGPLGTWGHHYAAVGVSQLPLSKALTAAASVLVGLDTGFYLASTSVSTSLDQKLFFSLGYRHVGTLSPGSPSELDALSTRHEVSLGVSAAF